MIDRLLSIESWRGMFTKYGKHLGWGLAAVFGIPLVVGFGMSQYGGRGQQAANTNAAANAPVVLVNGEPVTQLEYAALAQSARGSAPPGEQFAQQQGNIMEGLITNVVVEQEAKKRNVRASDADIDKAMQQERDAVLPKDASDSQWEQYISEHHNATQAEYREIIAKRLSGLALKQSFVNDEKVTEEEAKSQSSEVHLAFVLIPTVSASPLSTLPKGMKALPDADAKKKAEDLLAKAKAGGDIAAIAKANSSDFTAKQGGDLSWKPEFKTTQGMPASMGALGYGKEFDEAVHKAQKDQFTDVVKVTGFASGYAFAKVLDRRNNLPKDFDAKKVMMALKEQRATDKAVELIRKQVKAAKLEFKDPDKKAFYDYYKVKSGRQAQMMAQFGQGDAADAPSEAELAKLQADADKEIEEYLKRNPSDATAALLVADNLKQAKPGITPDQSEKNRERRMTLYETALKSMESPDLRFELAEYYRDKKQNDKAAQNYDAINRWYAANPPYDQQTMQQSLTAYQRLMTGYSSIGKTAEAAKAQDDLSKVMAQMAEERKKQDEERKKQADAAKLLQSKPGAGGASATGGPQGGTPPSPKPVTPQGADAAPKSPAANTPPKK